VSGAGRWIDSLLQRGPVYCNLQGSICSHPLPTLAPNNQTSNSENVYFSPLNSGFNQNIASSTPSHGAMSMPSIMTDINPSAHNSVSSSPVENAARTGINKGRTGVCIPLLCFQWLTPATRAGEGLPV